MNLLESDVIWRNGRLATMNAQSQAPYGLLDRHALVVRDKHIIAVIPEDELPAQHPQQIDLQDRLVTPGLIDCHTHLVFGGDRAYEWEQRLNGVSYTEISQNGGGINSTVRATRDASPDTLLSISQQRLQALMDEGVTTVEMKSGYGLDLINEEKQLRVAQHLARQNAIDVSPTLLSAHTTPPEYQGRSDHYIDLICEEILPQLWEKKLFESVDVFCESVGFSLAQSEKLFAAAKQLGIPVRGHMEQLSNLGGSELVARYHGLSTDHIEHLDEAGIQALAHSQTVAVLLPGAFYFLRETKRPPVDLLREYRVPMAVASDFNPGTSPFASLRLAMNMACVQFGLTPEEAWLGVTRHAAQALNRQHTHGQLAAGFEANFAVWEAEKPVEVIYELGRNPLYQRVYQGQATLKQSKNEEMQ